jgi:hypothetical protein
MLYDSKDLLRNLQTVVVVYKNLAELSSCLCLFLSYCILGGFILLMLYILCPVQWVLGALSSGVKWPECEVDHSSYSSAEVKNG